ncbi:MAG: EAL domain-containing protein [Anaerolineales bacterium]|nr:EAL domain-containing protein [Anaerolineales bacterium]
MSGETILVVDDNRQLAEFIANFILPSLGYKAQAAYNGESALKIIRSSQPSLMLLDLELPDTTGLEILRTLQQEGYNIPAILCTAHGSEHIAADAFRLGVEDYLVKPVDADELGQAISRALTETHLRQQAAQLTKQLEEQVSWLNALSQVGKSLTSTLDLNEVLRRILEAGVQLTQAEEGFLALPEPASGQFYLRAVRNIDQDQIKTMSLPADDPLIKKVIQDGRPLRIASQPGGAPVKISTGFLVQNLLNVPIFSKGQILGVLSVDNRADNRPFTQKDEDMLISLADYAAVALENANLYRQAQYEIRSRKKIESALRESEERYALAVQGANDGLWDWNLKTNRIYFSPRWKAMLGYDESEISDDPDEWLGRIHPQDVEKVRLALSAHIRGLAPQFESEHRVQHKDGSYRWVLSRGLAVRGQGVTASRIAGSQTDISARKAAEAKLLHDAFYDRLTSLPNRALFIDRLKSAIERSRRREEYNYAVLFLDLDQFKNVNDTLGHPVGDQLLVAIANLLQSNLRASDTVARLGGDEFVILLDDIRDESAATRISEWILRKFASPFRLAENDVFVTTSIGIVMSTLGHDRAEDVLRDADIAMYAAKAQGKATYEWFKPSMRERILKRVALEADLRQAIENEQIVAYYQPIVSLQSGKLLGFEALARWQHPQRGLVMPKEFIPLAQETGLIIPLDLWVFKQAGRQVYEWQIRFRFDPPLTLAVNISKNLFNRPDLIETIEQVLQATGLDRRNLKLEITESALTEHNGSTVEIIAKLNEIGLEVQIDDFGTGSSSLIHLQKFPAAALKVDYSFVQQLRDQGGNTEIVRAIIGLAHDLDMLAIAEGIETSVQLEQLKAMKCDSGQGFLLSHPLDVQATEALLASIAAGEIPFSPWKDLRSPPA